IMHFIKTHPDSFVSLYKLKQQAYSLDYASLKELYSHFNETIKRSKLAEVFATYLKSRASVTVGKVAPDFTEKNTEGEPVSLSDYKGEYVLIDFWSSTCTLCRGEHPNLKAAYEKY